MSDKAPGKLVASVYLAATDVYLAVLTDGREIQRGSLDHLAKSLFSLGIDKDNLLFGDWRAGAELLSTKEQRVLQYDLQQLEVGTSGP